MLEKLYDLVFGQKEYEKTKIEVRISLIQKHIPDIKIKRLEDFEKLEACIFKIKDQLRVKSSNLNKVANNPSRNLSRSQIDQVLTSLNNIKISFLQRAFNILEKVESNQIYIPEDYNERKPEKIISLPENTNLVSVSNNNFEKSETPQDEKNEEEKVPEKETFELDKVLITESDDAEIYIANGIKPYLLVKFHKNHNFKLLKLLSSLLYDDLNAHGTNIIVEGQVAMIIPRFENDKLIDLPVNTDIDLKQTQQKIFDMINKEKNDEYDEVKLPLEKDFKKHKDEDDSLDSLLEKTVQDEKKEKINPNKSKEKIKFIKDDEIEIEKEEKKPQPEEKIEIISKSDEIENENLNFQIYSDDKIVAELDRKGILGGLIVRTKNEEKLGDLNETDLSYIMLFSKIFSTVVFDSTQAQGTNMIWNFSSPQIKIIPRFENDNLKLTWEAKETSNEFLKQIQSKLLETLNREIKKTNNTNQNQPENRNQNKSDNPQSVKKQKAKYLINSLKRIG